MYQQISLNAASALKYSSSWASDMGAFMKAVLKVRRDKNGKHSIVMHTHGLGRIVRVECTQVCIFSVGYFKRYLVFGANSRVQLVENEIQHCAGRSKIQHCAGYQMTQYGLDVATMAADCRIGMVTRFRLSVPLAQARSSTNAAVPLLSSSH
jgi:hypothetical protein